MKTEIPHHKVEPYYIRQSHVSALFSVDRATIKCWREQGLLHPIKFRGTVLYEREELIKVISSFKTNECTFA